MSPNLLICFDLFSEQINDYLRKCFFVYLHAAGPPGGGSVMIAVH